MAKPNQATCFFLSFFFTSRQIHVLCSKYDLNTYKLINIDIFGYLKTLELLISSWEWNCMLTKRCNEKQSFYTSADCHLHYQNYEKWFTNYSNKIMYRQCQANTCSVIHIYNENLYKWLRSTENLNSWICKEHRSCWGSWQWDTTSGSTLFAL